MRLILLFLTVWLALAGVALGQTFPTIGSLPGIPGNTTNMAVVRGRPFSTITAAVAAAQAGDLVIVYPGKYQENNLLKKGVNYFFYPGSSCSYTSSTETLADGYGFFDERATGATTNHIEAPHTAFYFSAGTNMDAASVQANTNAIGGILLVTNPATRITMELGDVDGDFFFNSNPAPINGTQINPGLFTVLNAGKCTVTCTDLRNTRKDYVTPEGSAQAGFGFYWQAGETYFTPKHIAGWAANNYAVWANDTTTDQHADNFWVTPGPCEGKIYVSVASTNIRCWFNGQEFKTTNADNPFSIIGGKTYIVADKISGGGGAPIVYTGVSNSAIWVTAQKITASSGGQWFSGGGSGDIYLHVMQYEVASGSLSAAGGFQFAPSGNCPMHAVIEGGEALADGLGVNWAPTAGYVNTSYLRIKNLGLNTALADHAGNFSIFAGTNGIAVIGSRFKIPASCTNSIVAPLAAPQTVETYWSAANVTTNGAITFSPNAGWTVNANVK